MKYRIKVNRSEMLNVVPGSVWRQTPFWYEPDAFVLENPRLKNRIIEASAQCDSLESWLQNSAESLIYIVAGNPDDMRAKYFAAYLAASHRRQLGSRENIVWETVTGGFENLLLKRDIEPSMLILSGLAENSTGAKIEKARDLVERWPNIPRVVVCAGEDPISFAACRLHLPAHSVAYFPSSMSATAQVII